MQLRWNQSEVGQKVVVTHLPTKFHHNLKAKELTVFLNVRGGGSRAGRSLHIIEKHFLGRTVLIVHQVNLTD
jgi:hypothetical protein